MKRIRRKLQLGLAGLAFAALALPAAGAAAVHLKGVDTSGFPRIRASVVSSDGAVGRPAVTENGFPVAGFEAQNLGRAKALVLAVDRSQSMKGAPLADAAAAARSFVAAKASGDQVSVVAFGSHAATLSPFSVNAVDADDALSHLAVDPEQGTALYDAIVVAARQLRSNTLPGRVLIVLTDGDDTTSHRKLSAAIAAARAANVAVYPIGIEGSSFEPTPLLDLAQATGGQYFGASSTESLAEVYGAIAATLKRTWRVQYMTAARPSDRITVEASVVGAGTDASTVTIRGAAAAPPPDSKLPKGVFGPGSPVAVGLLVGLLMLLSVLFVFAGLRGSWVRNRIAAHVGETKAGARNPRGRRSELLAILFRVTERTFGHLKQWRWIGRTLQRANLPLRTVEFVWIVIGSGVAGVLLAAMFGATALLALTAGFVFALLPFAVVWLKMRRRLRAFEQQLPDLLITIAASLKAGHSFKQGLQAVVDEGQPPASDEFKRVLTETSLGRPMDDALTDMAERVGSKNFEFAITAVTIQRQVGGSLASLFDMVADTVRQRQQFALKIRGLTAMGRMGSYTLVGIPFFLLGAITVLNPAYVEPLYHTRAGHFMMLGGLVMMAMGAAVLKKIVSFRG